MKMTEDFSWKNPKIIWQIFAVGTLYFVIAAGYALIHYQENFLMDGTALLFEIANNEWFPDSHQREIMWLQQLLPVAAAVAGLKIKWIMIAYVLNTYLFYYVLFVIAVLALKDPMSGILLLLIHFKGAPYNYFMIVEELLPGVCMLIVFLSLLRNYSLVKNRFIVNAGLLFLLVCIIRSHPAVIICMGAALVLLLFTNREVFIQHKKIIIALGAGGAVLLAAKILFLNPYDISVLTSGKSVWQSFVQLLNPDYFFDLMVYFFYTRQIFTITFGFVAAYLLVKRKYFLLLTVLALVIASIAAFNTQLHDFEPVLDHTVYDVRSMPVRFIVFMAFCYVCINEIASRSQFNIACFVGIFYFIVGSLQIFLARERSSSYIEQAYNIIEACHEEGVKKALIHIDDLDDAVIVHNNCFLDIMVLSSLHHPDSCIQVVYVTDSGIAYAENLPPDSIWLNKKDQATDLNFINPRYFRIDTTSSYELVSFREWIEGEREAEDEHGEDEDYSR